METTTRRGGGSGSSAGSGSPLFARTPSRSSAAGSGSPQFGTPPRSMEEPLSDRFAAAPSSGNMSFAAAAAVVTVANGHAHRLPSGAGSASRNFEDQLARKMKQKVREISRRSAPSDLDGGARPSIYRVLSAVRREEEEAYEPRIVSVGPYHRGKDALIATEDLKWEFLRDIIDRDAAANSVEGFLRAARDLEGRARAQYADAVAMDSDPFVEMMVLDGCFVIELMIKWIQQEKYRSLDNVNWVLPLLRNDLLLVENQVPFFVLEALFDASSTPVSDFNFRLLAFLYVDKFHGDDLPDLSGVEFCHLLHLYHWSLAPSKPGHEGTAPPQTWGRVFRQKLEKAGLLASTAVYWLLSLNLLGVLLPGQQQHWLRGDQEGHEERKQPTPSSEEEARAPRVLPSATELQESGVEFKKKDWARCSLDASFDDGVLEIPRISIQGSSASIFRNLVAFEQCFPEAGNHFTSYMTLMEYLVKTPADVAVLKDCGIIESKLGSDKELALFFNRICRGGYLDFDHHYLVGLFKEVQKYCQAKRHRWRAMLVHDYFGSPWAVISFIAAFVLLIMTAAQTTYGILQYYRDAKEEVVCPC